MMHYAIFRMFAVAIAVSAMPLSALARRVGDDYSCDVGPSAAARECFSALPRNLEFKKVTWRNSPDDDTGVYFTEDGGISIPPGAMIVFRNAGRCMDPHLPAPRRGEPMQFVDVGRLVPDKIRNIYDRLIERSAQGDSKVAKNNLQHLVWALRVAGTDDPIASNLTDSQIELLDECAGRRGAFMKYHEREKARNAKKQRRDGGENSADRISAGGFSYDASDLRGTNAVRRIESHIAALTEMGEKSKETTVSDFRYGEIEDGLYSDITCDGGLSFTARILNASGQRREFRATDFAAQVGNGGVAGSRRQRVTMSAPDEVMVVTGAMLEEAGVGRDVTVAEAEGTARQRIRRRSLSERKERTAEERSRKEKVREKKRKTRTDISTTIEEPSPVPPVEPVPPIPPDTDSDTVTNEIARTVVATEPVSVRVIALEYDDASGKGMLTVEIVSSTFKESNKYIRRNIDRLVRRESPAEASSRIPPDAKLEIETITINGSDFCEVRFLAK